MKYSVHDFFIQSLTIIDWNKIIIFHPTRPLKEDAFKLQEKRKKLDHKQYWVNALKYQIHRGEYTCTFTYLTIICYLYVFFRTNSR